MLSLCRLGSQQCPVASTPTHLSPTRMSFSPCCAQCCSSWRMAHILEVEGVSNSPGGAA